jgi:hypothetical protein
LGAAAARTPGRLNSFWLTANAVTAQEAKQRLGRDCARTPPIMAVSLNRCTFGTAPAFCLTKSLHRSAGASSQIITIIKAFQIFVSRCPKVPHNDQECSRDIPSAP